MIGGTVAARAVLMAWSVFMSLAAGATKGEAANRLYYVSPSGAATNSGLSAEDPWSLQHAASEAGPGDTVILLDGTYAGKLAPQNSGNSRAPVVFRAANRLKAVLTGDDSGDFIIELENVAHVRLERLRVNAAHPANARWMKIHRAAHVDIVDMHFSDLQDGALPFRLFPVSILKAEYLNIVHSVFDRFEGGDLFHMNDSRYIKLEGNYIGRAAHAAIALSGTIPLTGGVDRSVANENVVIRGNVFSPDAWGRLPVFMGDRKVLVENNIFSHGIRSGSSSEPHGKVSIHNGVFRYNRIFRNFGAPFSFNYVTGTRDLRVYNNVFDDNGMHALQFTTNLDQSENVEFKNNVFVRSDRHGSGTAVFFGGDETDQRHVNNVYHAQDGAVKFYERDAPELYSLADVQAPSFRNGRMFVANRQVDPRLEDVDNYRHAPAPASPLLDDPDAFLTETTGAGMDESVLKVADSFYFFDGYNVPGERGDLITVGGASNVARVVGVDHDRRRLTLDRRISWSAGQKVSLRYSGTAPDIGAFEHGSQGHPTFEVVPSKYYYDPGQQIELRVAVRGDYVPVDHEWRLHDGALYTGSTLQLTLDQPGIYPVRVRMRDSLGVEQVAAGMFEVRDPRRDQSPILASEFSPGEFWKKHWYNYRPTYDGHRQNHRHRDGYMEMYADTDYQYLPLSAHVQEWNIDRWPAIRFRYMIAPGTPVIFYVDAFDIKQRNINDSDRRAIFAATASASPDSSAQLSNLVTLQDDGRWHILSVDARDLRELYPDVEIARRVGFVAVPNSEVSTGDFYRIDYFRVGPAK